MAQLSEPERPPPAAAPETAPTSPPPPLPPAPPPPATPRRPVWRRLLPWSLAALLAGALVLLALEELSESRLQARVFSAITARLSYPVEPGPSPTIRFPGDGPYDQRLGYHQLPVWSEALRQQGYVIEAQARWSAGALDLAELGLFTIAREKDQAGLSVDDCSGQALHQARFPQRGWARDEDLPALLVEALLFIENRELLDADRPRMNPAIEWLRLGKAVGEQALRLIGDDSRAPGGSTLATQMEKYRHSPDGRTDSAGEKLRQMVSATLRAYRDGPETMARRREIVRGYLNTVPLAARPGWGEVNGIGDGLWAWFGQDFDTANRLLREPGPIEDAALRLRRARVYKQALALMVAQRRPSYYLGAAQEKALGELTDSYLRVMAEAGVIPAALRDEALAVSLQRLPSAPRESAPPFSERKAATALRARLQGLLAIPRAYELDRLDLQVASTLDAELQAAVTRRLRSLREAEAAREAGLYGFRLLKPEDDPQHLQFSFTLYELGPQANRLRVQTDNVDQPFDINDGARLDLGSTAKLRTLVSYLELVAELHERWQGLDGAALRALRLPVQDVLGRWARDHLLASPDRSRATMLEAAMLRTYSASPHEAFFTGGGLHTFANFDKEDDGRVLSVRESLRRSVNLPFVRMMRDVVRHLVAQGPGAELLDDATAPPPLPPLPRGADAAARNARAEAEQTATAAREAREALRRTYLARYADREGREYLARFHPRYQGLDAAKVEERLLQSLGQAGAERLAAAWSVLEPQADASSLAAFLARNLPGGEAPPPAQLEKLWRRYFSPEAARSLPLEDRALVARIHPLELWTAARLRRQSGARLSELIAASDAERQGASAWLLRTRHRAAQDQRIRQMLDAEGFEALHRRWQRLGYPFETLTPSYASALGASGDRPAALAELMGILVNQGRRLPVARIERLAFAVDTPYETRFVTQPRQAETVLDAEVARVVRGALIEVVEGGTAGRLRGSLLDAEGKPIPIGGKTGTGDHRYEVYGRGGALISSRVVSRSGTFVFLIGERWFGTMMVYASAPYAEGYTFTSALPTQVLKSLMPTLQPLLRTGLCHAEPAPPEASLVAGPR